MRVTQKLLLLLKHVFVFLTDIMFIRVLPTENNDLPHITNKSHQLKILAAMRKES